MRKLTNNTQRYGISYDQCDASLIMPKPNYLMNCQKNIVCKQNSFLFAEHICSGNVRFDESEGDKKVCHLF